MRGSLCVALSLISVATGTIARRAAAQASPSSSSSPSPSSSPSSSSSSSSPFWERVSNPDRERFERLYDQADSLLSEGDRQTGRRLTPATKLAQAEALLREALALRSEDFRTLALLAEVQSIAGRPAAALATLERARAHAQLPAQEAACWFRLGVERSKLGQYAEAVADYDRRIALGDVEAAVYANSAEILMALGRLPESQDRYREAIRVDEQAPDRRAREHSLALSYYGLGVALDRDDQSPAAREMIARALALDPNLTKLTLAQQPGSDVFFIPDGDVFYYLGLASEVAGKRQDADSAFREFVTRQPKSRWIRQARAHLGALAAAERAGSAAAPRAPLRIAASGTVLASGPIAAPLVDAAWRERPQLLDACLDGLAPPARSVSPDPRAGFRLALELEIDARGAVVQATAKVPPPWDGAGAFARCAERAIKDGLRVTVSGAARGRHTRARVELLISAVASGDGVGL